MLRHCRGILAVFFVGCVAGIAGANPVEFDFSPSPLERIQKTLKAERVEVTAPVAEARPVVDGKLADAAWAKAPVLSFRPGGNANCETQVRILRFEDTLYFAATCRLDPAREPAALKRAHDDAPWKDDAIEIWIAADGSGARTCQFILNAAGSTMDLRGTDAGYNPSWQSAVSAAKGIWTAEIAIPMSALELPAWPRELHFNIGRNVPGVGNAAWGGAYGDISRGALVLAGVAQASEGEQAADGRELTLSFARTEAFPGERWLSGDIAVLRPAGALAGLKLRAALFALGATTPVATAEAAPERIRGRIRLDLSAVALTSARLAVELSANGRRLAATEIFVSSPARAPLPDGTKIPVALSLPDGVGPLSAWPATFGVPFGAGELWDVARLRLTDAAGREIPCQKEVMATWRPDGAVKWVRFDALVSTADGCRVEVAAPQAVAQPKTPVVLREEGERIVVESAGVRYVLGRGNSPIQEVLLDGKRVAAAEGARGLYVIDQKGRVGTAAAAEEAVAIEARGPVAVCVRFEGWYLAQDGARLARHITRVECFAGRPEAVVTHTLVLTEDTNKVWFKDIGWELAVSPGADPRAVFGAARDDWRRSASVPLAAGAAAIMFQDSHFYFHEGKNHFSVQKMNAAGKNEPVVEGGECGDWALLAGRDGGLAFNCKEAARQHPKEFEVRPDRMVLRLFSNRGGDELDFRSETLFKKWNVPGLVKNSVVYEYSPRPGESVEEVVRKLPSNAQGYAKTHQLLVMPVSGGPETATTEDVARASKLQRDPLYALADPAWTARSLAMGRLHPEDRKTFPDQEALIDRTFAWWSQRVPAFGEYGFVDYWAGPHIRYDHGDYPSLVRYRNTYTLRTDAWLLYARSGRRDARDFAERANITFMDAYVAHWAAPHKVKGVFNLCALPGNDFPYLWGTQMVPTISSSTDLNQCLFFYYLTGYRRARDCTVEYGEGIKSWWTPRDAQHQDRIIKMFQALAQVYSLTWDPEVGALARLTGEILQDPDAALGLSIERGYSSSYKTQSDFPSILDGWRILGDPAYRRIADKVAAFWWYKSLLGAGHMYSSPIGEMGNYLYERTGDPTVAPLMALFMRRAVMMDPPDNAAYAAFTFRGIPAGQALVEKAGTWGALPVSRAQAADFGQPVRFFLRKARGEQAELWFKTAETKDKGDVGAIVEVVPYKPTTVWAHDLNSVSEQSGGPETHGGVARVVIPKDAPGGAYELRPGGLGTHMALCFGRTPIVLCASNYWSPAPAQRPAMPIWFNLPKDSRNAQIFFEGKTRLFTPAGEPSGDGNVSGWVDLPADKPGLWHFVPVEFKMVRVRNLPPLFAFDDPAFYFDPGIEWKQEEPAVSRDIAPGTLYVQGAIKGEGNQALYLDGKRKLVVGGGPADASGNGRQFLPKSEGTIEFYWMPNEDNFDLSKPGHTPYCSLLRLQTEDARLPWSMGYALAQPPDTHVYFSRIPVLKAAGANERPITARGHRQGIVEKGEWVHVAWVWGQKSGGPQGGGLSANIYIDGKLGTQGGAPSGHSSPLEPLKLILGYDLKGAFDELRISDVQRYQEDFTPPSRGKELEADAHTRVLFHFNGNLNGVSGGNAAPLAAKIENK